MNISPSCFTIESIPIGDCRVPRQSEHESIGMFNAVESNEACEKRKRRIRTRQSRGTTCNLLPSPFDCPKTSISTMKTRSLLKNTKCVSLNKSNNSRSTTNYSKQSTSESDFVPNSENIRSDEKAYHESEFKQQSLTITMKLISNNPKIYIGITKECLFFCLI